MRAARRRSIRPVRTAHRGREDGAAWEPPDPKAGRFSNRTRGVSFLGLLALPEDNAITEGWEAVTERSRPESSTDHGHARQPRRPGVGATSPGLPGTSHLAR